jgi:hypothetical protein
MGVFRGAIAGRLADQMNMTSSSAGSVSGL